MIMKFFTKYMIHRIIFKFVLVLFAYLLPAKFAFANVAKLTNWTQSADIVTFLTKILDAVIEMGTLVVVMLVVYSGFLFVMAQGKDKELEDAKRSLWWVIIGSAIILGAWGITVVVTNTTTLVLP